MGGAAQAFARARARDEANLAVTLGERLMLPQVYEDLADVARWRARYRGGLDEVEREADRFLARAAAHHVRRLAPPARGIRRHDLPRLHGRALFRALDYVRIALEVAQDAARNAALREAITARRAALFDQAETVEAFAAALLRIGAGEARKTGARPL